MQQPSTEMDALKRYRDFAARGFLTENTLHRHLLLAAEKGDPGSQFNVGVLYNNGRQEDGAPLGDDRREAIRWLRKAARQGLPRARTKLAEVYADGFGPPRDVVMACFWFRVAATTDVGPQGLHAESRYDQIVPQLTPAQVECVQRLARNWKPAGLP